VSTHTIPAVVRFSLDPDTRKVVLCQVEPSTEHCRGAASIDLTPSTLSHEHIYDRVRLMLQGYMLEHGLAKADDLPRPSWLDDHDGGDKWEARSDAEREIEDHQRSEYDASGG